MTDKERAAVKALPFDEAKLRSDLGILPGVKLACETGTTVYEQTWRKPAVTVIAQEASTIKGASNQVLPKASAIVSCRIVPDMQPAKVQADIAKFLTADPPWGCKVKCEPLGATCDWWMTDPNGPAFEAALAGLRQGFDKDPIAIGCGGSIGFVGPLADLFGGAPALLLGIEDPQSQRPRPEREPARRRFQETDGVAGEPVRKPRQGPSESDQELGDFTVGSQRARRRNRILRALCVSVVE